MKHVLSVMLIVAGIIHLLPLSGVLGSDRLVSLFRPAYQLAALIGGFVSVLSFLYLAWAIGGYNDRIARVCVADVVALACLVIGGIAHALAQRQA